MAKKNSKNNGKKFKNSWKERYFVLVNYESNCFELRYYENDKMQEFKGVVDLSNVSGIEVVNGTEIVKRYGKAAGKGQTLCLEIVSDKKTLVMSFMDVTVRMRWHTELKNIASNKKLDSI